MDNRYQGQGQFGQNQQNQGTSMPNQQMPNQQMPNQQMYNQQMPNQYGQNPYMANQQMYNSNMPNQYGQGVNPNMYNGGNPYGMYNFDKTITPMDPTQHAEQVRKANTKKKVFIGLIIGAIVLGIAAFAIGIVALIGLIFKSYDVDDYDNVASACEEVLGVVLTEDEEDYSLRQLNNKGYEAVDYASGYAEKNNVKAEALWVEFSSSSEASLCYDELHDELEKQHEDIEDEFSSTSYTSGLNKVQYDYKEDGEQTTFMLFKSGKCIMLVQVYGDADDVEDKVDDLLDELD